ncbi:WAT1-related protein At1g25270-like isoform X2 [Mangifera indica]|uniref:WAT1-related protein At1g25270-like isoform X2 n=1 Tax=Mangifera indica TaxID=29780 RepID=UPI001CF968D4|nr:WAT1-related protein At1g25270-like isoform X2 [Mangifera indica]
MSHIRRLINDIKPTLLMVVAQLVFAGGNMLYKLAVNDGMSFSVMVAYRYIFSTAFMLPIALLVERKGRPKINLMIIFQAFLCSLFGGSLYIYLYLKSMDLTSLTFVTAMTNLSPAVTFVLALSFGLEKVGGIWSAAGKAKVLGTLMGISGAMLLTLYKGVEISIWSTNINLLHHPALHHSQTNNTKTLFGCLLALACCFLNASWLIIQAKMSEKYPCQYSSTALISLMAAIESAVFALFVENHDWSRWKLGFNIRLLTVVYTGLFSSGLMVTLMIWCVQMRGPLFVSVFSPLLLVLVALVASLLLEERLYLGSILGAAMIICGLYAVLWGKAKEMKKSVDLIPSRISGEIQSTEAVINSPTDYTSNGNDSETTRANDSY